MNNLLLTGCNYLISNSIINKITIAFTSFVPFVFISCLSLISPKVGAGNIDHIYSEVALRNNMLDVHNKVTFHVEKDDEGCIEFYLHNGMAISNLKVTNMDGEKLKHSITKIGDNRFIEVDVEKEFREIMVHYSLDLSGMKPSISHFRDNDQCFILPEKSIFPTNNAEFVPDNQKYTIKFTEPEKKYQYTHDISFTHSFMPPTLICGNFNVIPYKGVMVHVPSDIIYDKENIDAIVSSILDSYIYYSTVFGENNLKDINVFFLKRRGGYTFQDGIILDQKYVSGKNPVDDDLAHLIAHEIAHLWWGIRVRAKSWAITEGLAEFSSDFYLIEKRNQDPKTIYAYKNNMVLDSDIKPENIDDLKLSNPYYKAFAYHKMPIIFREMELKMGRSNLIKAFQRFYLYEKDSQKLCGFEEIIKHFPIDYQAELRKDLDGTKKWPDYFIEEISGNVVVFKGNNIYNQEIVPVELVTDKNKIIHDTLFFNVESKEITKSYDNNIVRIVIDKDFNTNQSILLNDFWSKDGVSLLDNKWFYSYNEKDRMFFDSLLNYLFTKNGDASIINTADAKNKSLMSKSKKELERINIKIYGSFLKIRKQDKYFKITVTFTSKSEFKNGYIEGYYYTKDDGSMHLRSIKRIKI